MKVIVPAAGKGQRFKDAGYKEHKPLIPVTEDKRIIDIVLQGLLNLFNPDDIIVIIRQDDDELQKYLLLNYPLTHRVKIQPHAGAADAVRIAIHKLSDSLDNPAEFNDLFIINSDQYLSIGEIRGFVGAMLLTAIETGTQVFNSPSPEDKWSFVSIQEPDDIDVVFIATEVAEKIKISNWANTGFYYFASSSLFLERFAKSKPMANGEHYIAPLLKMETNDYCVVSPLVLHGLCEQVTFHGLGTPEDLEGFKLLKERI